MKTRVPAALTTLLAVGLVGVAPAQASDAGLRKVVKRQEAKVAPLAATWRAADQAVQGPEDFAAAGEAAAAFRQGLKAYGTAVTPITTETDRTKRGKKRLLAAIRQFDLGLVAYTDLIAKAQAGAGQQSLKASFDTLNKRIDAAARDETAALRLIGFKVRTA